jgi:hypothetical protein
MLASTRRLGLISSRLFTIAFAATAICWSVSVMPVFWSETAIAQAATHIIAGEVYKPEAMEALELSLGHDQSSALRSSMLSKAAIIRLRSAEDAITVGDQNIIDRNLNTLGRAVDSELTNTPSDPYQWLVLFWLNNARNGFKPENLRYLKISYALGPYEGWIAIKRNRLALAIFSSLPVDLQEMAISEFVGLVRSQLYAEAADILAGPGWPIRQVLLAHLKELKEPDRRTLFKLLQDRNLDDLSLPGTEEQRRRPWEH